MRSSLCELCVQSLTHFDRTNRDGNRSIAMVNRDQSVAGSEVSDVIFEWNNRDSPFDPSIGSVEVVDVLFAVVIIFKMETVRSS